MFVYDNKPISKPFLLRRFLVRRARIVRVFTDVGTFFAVTLRQQKAQKSGLLIFNHRGIFLEARPGIEPRYTALQAAA